MTIDRALIGLQSEPVLCEVEKGAIRRFAQAIGDLNPVYAAGEIAPPTFPTTFLVQLPVELDVQRTLHGGEEYEYSRPIRVGDVLSVVRQIADVYTRHGRLGTMTFLVIEAQGRDQAGEPVFRSRSTIICR